MLDILASSSLMMARLMGRVISLLEHLVILSSISVIRSIAEHERHLRQGLLGSVEVSMILSMWLLSMLMVSMESRIWIDL